MTEFIILNGFDRSGTTLLANMLGCVEGVEVLMQPFHNTSFHSEQWKRETANTENPEMHRFLSALLDGKTSHITSPYHEDYSTADTIETGKTYIIKTTKLHMKVEWMTENFPEIKIVGMKRCIEGIICSIFRNNFYDDWYGLEQYDQFLGRVMEYEVSNPFLSLAFSISSNKLQNRLHDVQRMAMMIQARNGHFLPYVNQCTYKHVLDDPEEVCEWVLGRSIDYDVGGMLQEPQNLYGKDPVEQDYWKKFLSFSEKGSIDVVRQVYRI